MTCGEARKAIEAGTDTWTDAIEAHIAGCEDCAELAADSLGSVPSEAVPPSLAASLEARLAAVEAEAKTKPTLITWLRERPTPLRTAFVGVVAFGLALGLGGASLRADFLHYPPGRFLIELFVLIGLGFGAMMLRLRPIYRTHTPEWTAWAALAIAVALLAVAPLVSPVEVTHPAQTIGLTNWVGRAARCFTFGTAIALVPLAGLLLTDRVRPTPIAVVLTAVFGAAVGDLALHLHCPIVAPSHLLAGHATVLVALMLGLFAWNRPQKSSATV